MGRRVGPGAPESPAPSSSHRGRARSASMFAHCIPGLAPLLSEELAGLDGVHVSGSGFDGRSDVVRFQATSDARAGLLRLRLAEDVFVEVATASRSSDAKPAALASRLWPPTECERALSIWSSLRRPLRAAEGFRVIVRVRDERAFLRTTLRAEQAGVIARSRPRWRAADPADLEVWVSEYSPGQLVSGLRLSDSSMRVHGGRGAERSGALRPTVAAAMVDLAGSPDGVLLDPCCGSGTVLAEAAAVGWQVNGLDIDPEAVAVSVGNVPGATVSRGDARSLDFPDAGMSAYVSNLPFGRQYAMQGEAQVWLRDVLAEAARVVRRGGRVVLLAPQLPRFAVPEQLRPAARHPLVLLGVTTTIWAYDRA